LELRAETIPRVFSADRAVREQSYRLLKQRSRLFVRKDGERTLFYFTVVQERRRTFENQPFRTYQGKGVVWDSGNLFSGDEAVPILSG
jgi:hypothetical protein